MVFVDSSGGGVVVGETHKEAENVVKATATKRRCRAVVVSSHRRQVHTTCRRTLCFGHHASHHEQGVPVEHVDRRLLRQVVIVIIIIGEDKSWVRIQGIQEMVAVTVVGQFVLFYRFRGPPESAQK